MYEIEKNVPIPKHRGEGRGRILELLKTMEVGDSVVVDVSESQKGNSVSYAQQFGIKCVTKKVEGGFRIWRVQ